MDKNAIVNYVSKVVQDANKAYNINLPIPTVDFFEKGYTAGRAFVMENKLIFNTSIAKENPDTFHETVIHEVAHLVSYKVFGNAITPHGKEFKAVDKALGGRGTTCHSYDITNVKPSRTLTRYVCSCSCGSDNFTKKVTTGRFVCRKCGERLVFTGEVIKIKP